MLRYHMSAGSGGHPDKLSSRESQRHTSCCSSEHRGTCHQTVCHRLMSCMLLACCWGQLEQSNPCTQAHSCPGTPDTAGNVSQSRVSHLREERVCFVVSAQDLFGPHFLHLTQLTQVPEGTTDQHLHHSRYQTKQVHSSLQQRKAFNGACSRTFLRNEP